MFVHWDDIDTLNELGRGAQFLDLATGHFTEDANETTQPLDQYGDEVVLPTRSNASPATVWHNYIILCELRARRSIVLDDPDMLALLDDVGLPVHDAALTAYIARIRRAPRRERLAGLLARVIAEREDRATSLHPKQTWYADDFEFAMLRLDTFDDELRRRDPMRASTLLTDLDMAHLSRRWTWLSRFEISNDPPWLPDVIAWRTTELAAAEARVARLLARLELVAPTKLPGATSSDLDAFEAELGSPLVPALRQLLAWHADDGTNTELMPVAFAYSLLPLGRIRDRRREMLGWWHDHPQWWHPSWIPLLEDPSGNVVALDVAGSFTGMPNNLIVFRHDSIDRDVIALDLESWLETLLAMYERHVFPPDDTVTFRVWSQHALRMTGSMYPYYEGVLLR